MQHLLLPGDFGALYLCPAGETEKAQSTAAHALLSDCLLLYAQERQICVPDALSYRYSEMGKPSFAELPEVQFNLSHCGGAAVCLLSPFVCGVDVEKKRPLRPKVVSRVFSEEEQRALRSADDPDLLFTRLWTLKESYVKAIGIGISYPLKKVSFSFSERGILCSESGAQFWHTEMGAYCISVCILRR